jgi:C_GCAxxG_C_C family probable redox protein
MKRSRESSSKLADRAAARFAEGFNCAQSILLPFTGTRRLSRISAMRLASPFGAGIGRLGGTCGAVTGAIMALGLRHGHTKATIVRGKEEAYRLARDLVHRFVERNGSLNCKDLLGCDLGTPEGAQIARDWDFHHTRCPKFVRDAVEILIIVQDSSSNSQ